MDSELNMGIFSETKVIQNKNIIHERFDDKYDKYLLQYNDISFIRKKFCEIFSSLNNAIFITGDFATGDSKSIATFSIVLSEFFGLSTDYNISGNKIVNLKKKFKNLCTIGGPVDTFTSRVAMGYEEDVKNRFFYSDILRYYIELNTNKNKNLQKNYAREYNVCYKVNGEFKKDQFNFCIRDRYNNNNNIYREVCDIQGKKWLLEDIFIITKIPNFFSERSGFNHFLFTPIHSPAQMSINNFFSNNSFFNKFSKVYSNKCVELKKDNLEYFQAIIKVKFNLNKQNFDYSINNFDIIDICEINIDEDKYNYWNIRSKSLFSKFIRKYRKSEVYYEKEDTMNYPNKLSDNMKKFAGFRNKQLNKGYKKVAFIIMRYGISQEEKNKYRELADYIIEVLQNYKIFGIRADEADFGKKLEENIETYMYGCDFGIAIFDKHEKNEYNPNVSYEIGFLSALQKEVCIIKDVSLPNLPSDLLSSLYKEVNINDNLANLRKELVKWLNDHILSNQ